MITRMARNAFLISGGSISLVPALFAFPAAETVVVADPVEAAHEDGLHAHLANNPDDQSASAGRLQLGENRRPTTLGGRPVTEPVGPVTCAILSLACHPLRAAGNDSSLRPIQAGTAPIRSRRHG